MKINRLIYSIRYVKIRYYYGDLFMTTDILYMIFGWAIWVAFIAIIIHHRKSMKKFYNDKVPFDATIFGHYVKAVKTSLVSPWWSNTPGNKYYNRNK